MISKICPQSYRRYTSLPLLGPVLNEFTIWFHRRGYAIETIKNNLRALLQIDSFLRKQGVKCLNDLSHNSFEDTWDYYHRNHRISIAIRPIEQFLDETHGLAPSPTQPKSPAKSELERFADFLRTVRGLRDNTVKAHLKYLQEFLDSIGYNTNVKVLTKLTAKKVEDFIQGYANRLSRYSLSTIIGFFRNFLKFEYEQNVLENPIYIEVTRPAIYNLERLPRSLPWEMIKKFLDSINQTNGIGIRDYTMFFLIATYGLRPCEIVSLALDDIHWSDSMLRIAQSKTDNQLNLPLTNAAGETLIKYLKESRPKNASSRNLFLKHCAPYDAIKPASVTATFSRQVRRSGLDIQSGPYCLRHSYAVHLLQQNIPLKTIGDLLGHQTAESTYVYLRLNVKDLRSVALPLPRGPDVTTPLRISIPPHRFYPQSIREKIGLCTSSGPLGSFLAQGIQSYLRINQALGRIYKNESITLHSLDGFILKYYPASKDLTAEMFHRWCSTFSHLSLKTRRDRMFIIRKFCLYRCRSQPQLFVPDRLSIPAKPQKFIPYIFSEAKVARLLSATQYLRPRKRSPMRAQTFRIAILILYSTGLRKGELLGLKLADYNSVEKTLFIRDTKFHKSRLVPLAPSVAAELDVFLKSRAQNHLPMHTISPLIWRQQEGSKEDGYKSGGLSPTWRALCNTLKTFTREGKIPRLHDLRHSFACNALQRWYEAGENVQAKLPLLSNYMGHVSIASTYYYLSFVKGIRSEASKRFEQKFGKVIK